MKIYAQRLVLTAGIAAALLGAAACGGPSDDSAAPAPDTSATATTATSTAGAATTIADPANPLAGKSLCFLTADEQKQLGVSKPIPQKDGSCVYSNPSKFNFSLGTVAHGLSGLQISGGTITHPTIAGRPAVQWSVPATSGGGTTCTVFLQLTPTTSFQVYAWYETQSGPATDSCPLAVQAATVSEKHLP